MKEFDHLSDLAKLRPDEEEKKRLEKDLEELMQFVRKLEEVDTNGVEPLKHVMEEKGRARPDEIRDEVEQQEALKNAPQRDSDYIKVPKFVRKEGGS